MSVSCKGKLRTRCSRVCPAVLCVPARRSARTSAARLVAQRYCTVWYTDTLDQYCHASFWASNIDWLSVQPKLIIIKFNRFLYDNCDLISQQWDHGSDWCGSLTQPSMQQTSYYLYLVSRARQSFIILILILLPFPPTCFRADN